MRGWLRPSASAYGPAASVNKLNEAINAGEFDLALSALGRQPGPGRVLGLQTCANRPNAQGRAATPESYFCDPPTTRCTRNSSRSSTRPAHRRRQADAGGLYDRAPEVILPYTNALEAYRKDRFAPFPTQPDPGGR